MDSTPGESRCASDTPGQNRYDRLCCVRILPYPTGFQGNGSIPRHSVLASVTRKLDGSKVGHAILASIRASPRHCIKTPIGSTPVHLAGTPNVRHHCCGVTS